MPTFLGAHAVPPEYQGDRDGYVRLLTEEMLPEVARCRLADGVATTIGSWRFIAIQSVILLFWIALNVTAWVQHWDPYPFILLNLALSFQAAY